MILLLRGYSWHNLAHETSVCLPTFLYLEVCWNYVWIYSVICSMYLVAGVFINLWGKIILDPNQVWIYSPTSPPLKGSFSHRYFEFQKSDNLVHSSKPDMFNSCSDRVSKRMREKHSLFNKLRSRAPELNIPGAKHQRIILHSHYT